MEHVSAQEAHRLIEDEHAVLIDCREDYEWEEMRVEGARLVPLSEYEGDPSMVEKHEKVIFMCAAGQRSQTAASIYEQQNAGASAWSMDGGITDWATRGFPIQVGPPSA